jgi:protein involved in polysaccharide export with SLBB domain
LYGSGFYEDLIVQPNDVLFVPFIQYYVIVNGAVVRGGRFPYVSGRTYEYYVNLAGGFDVNRNVFDSVVIKTKDGKKLSKKSVIPPEAVITAKANSPSGGWLMPIIVSILTLISTVLTCFVSIHDIGWI